MQAIVDFINSPLASLLLRTHPNEYNYDEFSWIHQADNNTPGAIRGWESLFINTPPQLKNFVYTARTLAIDRTPMPLRMTLAAVKTEYAFSKQGMSPKKEHEVTRMIAFISSLASCQGIKHAVDIGSGQGYLTRALNDELGLDVLALDSNPNQTIGAERWARNRSKVEKAPTITHRTLFVTPESLRHAIDGWISSSIDDDENVPVLFVALHACGSLTLDILRSFYAFGSPPSPTRWRPAALLLVGCCYNLLDPRDFPMSSVLKSSANPPKLGASALQLATQVPELWLTTESTRKQAHLAIRKVVYRALFQHIHIKGSSVKHLGKLNDRYYDTWEAFVEQAKKKMEVDEVVVQVDDEKRREKEIELEVLHALRCLIGPVVESLILLDRMEWVKENIDQRMHARLINLFDQTTGSGRNMAIVIERNPTQLT